MEETKSPPPTTLRPGLAALLRTDQPTLQMSLETFLHVGLSGRSPQTVEWYRKRLSGLVAALGPDQPVGAIMDADLIDWYADLEHRTRRWGGRSSHPSTAGGLAADTLHGYARAVKFFFKWLTAKRVLHDDPSRDLPLPQLPKRKREGVRDSDAQAILDAAGDDLRDTALLKFIASTGCRRGGVANLRLADLDLGQRQATVIEKGSKQRPVFLTAGAASALSAWLAQRATLPVQPPDDDHVFLGSKNGQPWRPLTPNGVSSILTRYKRKLAIAGRASPHQWRHRWARKAIANHMPLGIVSQAMGHSGSKVTHDFYGQFDTDELKQAFDKYVDDD